MVSVSTIERTTRNMLKNLPLSKILLSLAAVSVIAVGAVGGTFANFTATPTSIASNAFASGSLTMTRTGSGAIFNASAMKIGDSVTGTVTITNSGTLAGAYSLAGSSSGSAALTSQLNLKVYKDVDGGSALYDGSLGGFSSASLGRSLPAATRTPSTSTSASRRPGPTPATTSSRACPPAPRSPGLRCRRRDERCGVSSRRRAR